MTLFAIRFKAFIKEQGVVHEELLRGDASYMYENYRHAYREEGAVLEKFRDEARNGKNWSEEDTRTWEHQIIPDFAWEKFSKGVDGAFKHKDSQAVLKRYFEGFRV